MLNHLSRRYMFAFAWAVITLLLASLAIHYNAPPLLPFLGVYVSGYWFAQFEQALEQDGSL